MWQHKQEERELKRAEGDIIKKQRHLNKTMQEYETGNSYSATFFHSEQNSKHYVTTCSMKLGHCVFEKTNNKSMDMSAPVCGENSQNKNLVYV